MNRLTHDNDIERVTRLLEEKERDLELTAQIGKELLEQNQILERKVNELETDIKTANENLAQLSHELHQKNDLVAILTSDLDDSSENGKIFLFNIKRFVLIYLKFTRNTNST